MSLKILITGTGRCGTGYMAQLFHSMGIRTGHERVYTVGGSIVGVIPEIECSWLAVPYLGSLHPNVRVIHLVREPLATIRSLVDNLFGVKNTWWEFAKKYSPMYQTHKGTVSSFTYYDSDLLNAAAFYINWNRTIELHASHRLNLENIGVSEIDTVLRDARLDVDPSTSYQALDVTPRDTNSRPIKTDPLTYDDFPMFLRQDLIKIAKDYDYA